MQPIHFNAPYVIDANGNRSNCRFDIIEKAGRCELKFTAPKSGKLHEVVLFDGAHGFSHRTPFYGDGYQKLSQYCGTVSRFDTFTGFRDKDHYKMPQTKGFKTVYNYALFGNGSETMLIGAASCNRFRTEIRINRRKLQIVQCLEDLNFQENETVRLEDMVTLRGEKNEILKHFSKIICENHPAKTYFEMPVGWCSWYCVGPDISEKDIFDNLKIIKEKTPALKYIQIDDGFQPFMGDWLETSNKFDRPMQDICKDIKQAGFEPAIWLAPFIASPKSKLLKEHPDYFVQDKTGAPLCAKDVTFGGWRDGPWYMLDATNPHAQEFLYNTVREIYQNWGVKYFKLDANVWGALPFGVRFDKNATAVEAYRKGMETIFKAVDDNAYILGCNAPMWPSLGLVSAMRVTNDVIRGVQPAMSLAAQCFHRSWMHKTLWVNDPDCLIMTAADSPVLDPAGKEHKNRENEKFYKINNIYIRASGGMVLSGDYISRYSDKQIARLQRILKTDYQPAEFNDTLEVGRKETENGTEYFIFNQYSRFRKYEILVPEGFTATDLYENTPLAAKNGKVTLYMQKNDCAWIGISRR